MRDEYGESVKRFRRNVYFNHPCPGPLRQPEMAVVHRLRRLQSLPIRIHKLVPYDVGFRKVRNKINKHWYFRGGIKYLI